MFVVLEFDCWLLCSRDLCGGYCGCFLVFVLCLLVYVVYTFLLILVYSIFCDLRMSCGFSVCCLRVDCLFDLNWLLVWIAMFADFVCFCCFVCSLALLLGVGCAVWVFRVS